MIRQKTLTLDMPCDAKRADPTTHRDVDKLILDFLSYMATEDLLRRFPKSDFYPKRTEDLPQRGTSLQLAGCECYR